MFVAVCFVSSPAARLLRANIVPDDGDLHTKSTADEGGGHLGHVVSAAELYRRKEGYVERDSKEARAMALATTRSVREAQREAEGFTKKGSPAAILASEEAKKKRPYILEKLEHPAVE